MSDWPFGEYPSGGLERLGPHVTAYFADAFPLSNSAIVRGGEATLVFDANCFRFARALRVAVDAAGPPASTLVLSHVHDDHSMGAMLFSPPARVHARASVRERLARTIAAGRIPGAQYERGYPGAEEEGREVRIVPPDVDVEQAATIDLGDAVRVHLHPEGPAHTDGDLWAFVEPDGVVLCGDLWYVDCEPYVGSGSVRGLLAAIANMRDAGGRIYLPGHGPARALAPAGGDPVERYGVWLLDETAAAVERGLAGADLVAVVRSRFEEQRSRAGGVDFPLRVHGFLEVTVAAAERDVRGA